MLGNFNGILEEIQKLQDELRTMNVEAKTEEGTVKVVMNGHQEIIELKLEQNFLRKAPIEEIQKAVISVFERALKESKQMVKDEVSKATGGLGLPNIPGLL